MEDTLLVILLVLASAIFLGIRGSRSFQGKGGGCGRCNGCRKPQNIKNCKKTGQRKMKKVRLREMKQKQCGTISAVKVGGDLGRRIREMGMVPGTTISILGRAPLNDPVSLRVLDFNLTLRNSEADHIEVEVG